MQEKDMFFFATHDNFLKLKKNFKTFRVKMINTSSVNTIVVSKKFELLNIVVDQTLPFNTYVVEEGESSTRIEGETLYITGNECGKKSHSVVVSSGYSQSSTSGNNFSISSFGNITDVTIDGRNVTTEFKILEQQSSQRQSDSRNIVISSGNITIHGNTYGSCISGGDGRTINGIDVSSLFENEELPPSISVSIRISPSLNLTLKNVSCKDILNIDGINSVKIQNSNIKFSLIRTNTSFTCYLDKYCEISVDDLIAQNVNIHGDEYSKCLFGSVTSGEIFGYEGGRYSKLAIRQLSCDSIEFLSDNHAELSIQQLDVKNGTIVLGRYTTGNLSSTILAANICLKLDNYAEANITGHGLVEILEIDIGRYSKLNIHTCIGKLTSANIGDYSDVNVVQMHTVPTFGSIKRGRYGDVYFPSVATPRANPPPNIRGIVSNQGNNTAFSGLPEDFIASLTPEQLLILTSRK